MKDDVMGRSAQLSFYFFLAFFPLLLCVISLLAIFAGEGAHMRREFVNFAYEALPETAAQLVDTSLTQAQAHAYTRVSLGGLLLLWSASSGMLAVMDTINSAYEVEETRPFVYRVTLAIGLTLVAALALLIAAAIVVGGAAVADRFTGGSANFFLKIVLWPVAVALALFGFALIYFVAPDVKDQSWRWVSPGAVMALLVWVIASVGLKVYFHFSTSYGREYGSLAAVTALLLWFYISGAAMLIGAELNHAIDRVAAEREGTAAKSESQSPGKPSLHASAA